MSSDTIKLRCCDICGDRPATEWMVVRNVNEQRHVAKAHVCAKCFAGVQEESDINKHLVQSTVESVSQQDWNEAVEWPVATAEGKCS